MDAGHFVLGTYLIHKYNEQNVHAQCRYCNRFLEGNRDQYFVAMENKYGRAFVDHLIATKHQPRKFKPWELEELIVTYKQKVAQLEIQ